MPKVRADAKPITLTIDGYEVTVPEGTTVLDAAKAAGIFIPYLCAHPALRPWGACRMCMVEIENMRGVPTACNTPVAPNMVVHTNTPQVLTLRRNVMELILTEHPIGCLSCHKRDQCGPQETCLRSVAVDFRCVTCPANYRCELQMNCDYVGLDEIAMPVRTKNIPLRTDPLIALDWNLCIVCGRCVRVCDEVRAQSVYAIIDRAGKTMIDTAEGASLEEAGCIFCGACIDVCPVGAIEERRNRFAGVADSTTESVCHYCSDGCVFRLEQKRGTLIRVGPVWEAEVNGGQYCIKGRFATAEPIASPARLVTPLIRKNGRLVDASWSEALDLVAREFGARIGGQIGVIGSVRTTNEASYLLQKLARLVLRTPHIDTPARLSDAAGLLGMYRVLGAGASTTLHDAINETRCILLVGNNLSHTSPITAMKLLQAIRPQVQVPQNTGYFSYLPDTSVREAPRPKVIVIDPRAIEPTRYADLWLRPKPGTDRVVLGAMLKLILDEGLAALGASTASVRGVDDLRESLAPFTLAEAERLSGVPAEQIAQAARLYATSGPALAIFGRGLTQQRDGVAAVAALCALAVLTGNIGKPNAGILFPVGANNTRGAFDLGLLPEFLPGYAPADDEAARQRLEAMWGGPIAASGGLTLQEQLDAAREKRLTAMYIVGANPAQSAAEGPRVREALDALEFLVVQDLYLTETAKLADVVLPAASFAEQDGTFTNAERRVQRIRKAIAPLGSSRPDWEIIAELAARLGSPAFPYVHPTEIFDEIARVSPLHAGMSYDRLDDGPLPWPCPSADAPGAEVLFTAESSFTLHPLDPPQAVDAPAGYPLLLGLTSSFQHFGTGVQTRLVKQFAHFQNEERLELNPDDAAAAGIVDGAAVLITTPYGVARARATVTSLQPPGTAAVTINFPESGVNGLFGPERDPAAKSPVFKAVPARISAA
ncbi:MAG: molybdopterin-dependent oxidoreductase [Chloroflexota bacterium]|nr:molybdopterin-dependent oxidoreductase [Dehalococcoidia bacterium]MDW8253932.1 molybdopterin-dependent oxidoreductase [Chloroflexota bacterium]